jgi:predicted nucleotidyltransferase
MTGSITVAVLRQRRDDIARVAATHHLRNVRVFGSVARNTADERSDVDLLVDFAIPVPDDFEYYGILAEAQEDLEALLGRKVHVVHIERPAESPGRDILAQAVAI